MSRNKREGKFAGKIKNKSYSAGKYVKCVSWYGTGPDSYLVWGIKATKEGAYD